MKKNQETQPADAAAPPRPTPSSPAVSSRMSRQRRQDTAMEVAVRKLLHSGGLRYRVGLPVPGIRRRTIDIAFTRAKVAIFLDGCFWHGCPEHATRPKANAAWWQEKLARNVARDLETTEHLERAGWLVLRFWEHEAPQAAAQRIRAEVAAVRSGPQRRFGNDRGAG
ncbi:very short patch repair endonuclease [Kitasatospora sp. NPDC057223]|uniref:very short patch repair endonuclease n=1 Tax=Kitasatospora sp. NPDC057223 TaxID=3346055 RepID=UPI0036434DA0